MLHLIDTGGPGGAETIFLNLVEGLAAHGWDSVPVVPEEGWLSDSLRGAGHEPVLLTSKRAFDARYLVRLRGLIRHTGAPLIQTHLLTTSVYSSAASMGTTIPVVSTFHGLPDVGPDGVAQRVKVGLLGGSRNHLVFVSDSLARALRGRLGLPPDRCAVIHNGIDLRAFAPGPRGAFRKTLGLGPDTRLLGAVGNVRPSKAYDVLVRGFARIAAAWPDVRLAIAGQAEGRLFEQVRDLARSLGVDHAVHFVGFVPDVAAFLRDLDVFVLSSNDEGFSLATTQAMATGLPVVATRCGGPEEIVEDGRCGLLVPVGDPDALAAGVLRVLREPGLAGRLAGAARDHVEERFSLDGMVASYSDLYDRCLAG